MEGIYVCEEMKKFRDALDERGIQWTDGSSGVICPICMTSFKIGRTRFSVINGYGTYGGYWERSPMNKGLLELRINSRDPTGYLTAEKALICCGIGGEENGQSECLSAQSPKCHQ